MLPIENVNISKIGSTAGSQSISAKHSECIGENGFCPTGCPSGWQFYKNPWEVDQTMQVKCVG